MSEKKSVFKTLNAINVNEHTELKNGLTYLPWAWAWSKVKENYPDANYTIYDNENGWNYHTDGRTAWVKTGVTIDGIEHIEELPVMDYRNKSIPLDSLTSTDVNKAIQRSLTKAVARHGLGLYIYAGEDLPSDEDTTKETKPMPKKKRTTSLEKEMQEQVTDTEISTFKKFCTDNGFDYKEVWVSTGAATDLSKAHLGLAQTYVIEHKTATV